MKLLFTDEEVSCAPVLTYDWLGFELIGKVSGELEGVGKKNVGMSLSKENLGVLISFANFFDKLYENYIDLYIDFH